MGETLLRKLIEHPKRGLIVTILTTVVGLVFVWPAVDNYSAAAARRSDLNAKLEEGKEAVERLDLFRQEVAKREAQVRAEEGRLLTEEAAQQLRTQLVQTVRAAGCTMRRIRLADASQRDWLEADDPLAPAPRGDLDKKTPFKLRTRTLTLSIGGALPNVMAVLAEIHQLQGFLKTSRLALRRAADNPNLVELELDLLLFDLTRPAGPG